MGKRYRRLLSSIGSLRPDLWQNLCRWKSIQGDYYVAGARTSSGESHSRMIFMPRNSQDRQAWYPRRGFFKGFYLHDDAAMVEVSSVVDVYPSASRTPEVMLRKMLEHVHGPNPFASHMFGLGVRFVLKDGTIFWHTSGEGGELEFTIVPQGYTVDDLLEVEFPRGEECERMPGAIGPPDFKVCLFVLPGAAPSDNKQYRV